MNLFFFGLKLNVCVLTQTWCRNVHQSDTVRGQGVTSLTAVSASALGHKYLRSLCCRGKLPFCRLVTKLCGFPSLSDVTSRPGLCLPRVKISAKFWAPPVKIGVRFFTSVRDRKRRKKRLTWRVRQYTHTRAHTSSWVGVRLRVTVISPSKAMSLQLPAGREESHNRSKYLRRTCRVQI